MFPPQSDLVHTIGESAVLGVDGVVLWGSSEYAQSQVVKSSPSYLQISMIQQ